MSEPIIIKRPIGNQAGEWKMVFETPHSVSLVTSELVKGTTADGKNWQRFQTNSRHILTVRTGRLEQYESVRAMNRNDRSYLTFRNTTPTLLTPESHWGGPQADAIAMRELFIDKFPGYAPKSKSHTDLAQIAYPMLELKPEWHQNRSNRSLGMTASLRREDPKQFTEHVFGAAHYRKDLMKAATSKSLAQVATFEPFRGLVPADWITKALNESIDADGIVRLDKEYRKYLRQVLRFVPEKVRRALLTNSKNHHSSILRYVEHTATQARHLIMNYPDESYSIPNTIKTWEELYDRLNIILRDLANKPRVVPQTPIAVALDGAEPLPGYRLESAKMSTDLSKWGDSMQHCIGSYADEAVRGNSTYFALLHKDKMIANLEVSQEYGIGQFYGKLNANVEHVVDTGIRAYIDIHGGLSAGAKGGFGQSDLDYALRTLKQREDEEKAKAEQEKLLKAQRETQNQIQFDLGGAAFPEVGRIPVVGGRRVGFVANYQEEIIAGRINAALLAADRIQARAF